MTTTTWSVVPRNNTDAEFRAWGSAIATALAAIGLVQTSDTGQINWTTVLTPSATNQTRGYEIWRFNDSLQATAPIFIKLEYGSGNQNASGPAVIFTVGKGSNGSGTITDVIHGPFQAGYGSSASSQNCYATSSDNGFVLTMAPLVTFSGVSFLVERSCNSSGTPTNEAVAAAWGLATNTSTQEKWRVAKYSNVILSQSNVGGFQVPSAINGVAVSTTTSVAKDADTSLVLPMPFYAPGISPWMSKLVGFVMPGDIGASSVMTLTLYGASRSFRGFPAVQGGGLPIFVGSGSATYITAAMAVD
jgi:hypothetical protein